LLADVAIVEATKWLVAGYFFKLFVANNLNQITSNMEYPLYEALTAKNRWLCVFLYSYQIYADFFGYSAIAIGLALLFGYRLPKNFNLPYISTSFAQFWRRWHISFSTWLRTYLYIPLGGNREGSARTYLNLMIVMGLGGFWNGAAIGYLAWGTVARSVSRGRKTSAAANGCHCDRQAFALLRPVPPRRCCFLSGFDGVDIVQAAELPARRRLSARNVCRGGYPQSFSRLQQPGAAIFIAGSAAARRPESFSGTPASAP
jgi:hypothetical protein